MICEGFSAGQSADRVERERIGASSSLFPFLDRPPRPVPARTERSSIFVERRA